MVKVPAFIQTISIPLLLVNTSFHPAYNVVFAVTVSLASTHFEPVGESLRQPSKVKPVLERPLPDGRVIFAPDARPVILEGKVPLGVGLRPVPKEKLTVYVVITVHWACTVILPDT